MHVGLAGWDDAAISAPTLFSEPVDGVCAGQYFHPCFGQRLTLLQRHQAGHPLDPVAQQLGGPAHDFVALEGTGLAPDRKAAHGGGGHFLEVGCFSAGHLAHHRARGRVDHRQAAGGGTVAPVAIDEKLDVGIVGHKRCNGE